MQKNKIYTFWEPKNSVPQYLELCFETWKKYLPNYQIVVLNYSNLFDYLDKDFFDDYFFKNFSLTIQSDAIRCAVLKKFGGIWMDADTVLTSFEANKFFNLEADFSIIFPHICFIKAKKESKILDMWFKRIKKRVYFHKKAFKYGKFSKFFLRFFKSSLYKKLSSWAYLGNDILNPIIDKVNNTNDFLPIKRDENFCMPELLVQSRQENQLKRYLEFYFENDFSDFVFKNSKGLILLHNSWTPLNIKRMSKDEFISCSNTIAKILVKSVG